MSGYHLCDYCYEKIRDEYINEYKEELKEKIKDSLKILKEKIDSFECAGDELQNEDVLGAYSAFEYILKLLEE